MSSAFHLINKEAKRERLVLSKWQPTAFLIEISWFDTRKIAQLLTTPRITAEETHFKSFFNQGTSWGSSAITLRTVTLVLVHFAAEYCPPARCCSFRTLLIDPIINKSLRIIPGCLRKSSTKYLPALAGIPPAKLCLREATLSLACRAMKPNDLVYLKITALEQERLAPKIEIPF